MVQVKYVAKDSKEFNTQEEAISYEAKLLACKTPVFTYFEVEHTVDEYRSTVTGTFATEDAAREYNNRTYNWYASKPGGGMITKIEIFKTPEENVQFKRTQIKGYTR